MYNICSKCTSDSVVNLRAFICLLRPIAVKMTELKSTRCY